MGRSRNTTDWTDASVDDFIAGQPSEKVRADSRALIELMSRITGEAPRMWGPTIVGFGSYHYRYASGREGDAPLAAFSPRRPELVIYVTPEALDAETMAGLGKHRATKACVYVKQLDDVNLDVLATLVERSISVAESTYPQDRS
ncbi:DUF1801 domain-containing protein [Herbiconiux ginsengi]|uniref:YdhG-like domain-containing protein n=1 Tax=Herbiconiux ginsengi TaxID=381665 RepID=A0A1H3QEJ1_9MICO|nr:DUF1801 domain-containing protein [Herbiconiux ginsengi]SDZ11551.1 protein of unknown function (DU1801) [Herbiconiux ginsengi]